MPVEAFRPGGRSEESDLIMDEEGAGGFRSVGEVQWSGRNDQLMPLEPSHELA